MSSFQDSLNQVVKKIKMKQQIVYELIQYIQNIYVHKDQLEIMVFMQDQISKHSNFLNRIQTNFILMIQYQNQFIIDKYSKSSSLIVNKSQKISLKRVAARLLEIFQFFNEKIEKFHLFQEEITLNYRIHKNKIIKLINQIDKIQINYTHISQIFKCFFQYSNNKFNDQIKKLRKIIQLIQNGQIYELQNTLKYIHVQQRVQTQPLLMVQQNTQHQSKNESKKTSVQKPYQSIPISSKFSNQRQKLTQKLKIMRRQSKQRQIASKKLKKFASKYYSLYQNAMDINKNHFIDEVSKLDKKAHSEKILADILLRNKQNQQYIKQYVSVCQEKKYDQKSFSQIKTYSLQQEQKEDKIIIQKEQNKQNLKNHKSQVIVQTKQKQQQVILNSKFNSVISEDLNDVRSFRISHSKKAISSTPNSNTNLFVINSCNESYNFVKLNVKNIQTNANPIRSKLPGISNRLFSMQDKRKSTGKISNKQLKQIYVHQTNVVKGQLLKSLQLKSIDFKSIKKYQSGQSNGLTLEKKSTLNLDNKKNCQSIISKKLNKFSEIISENQTLLS